MYRDTDVLLRLSIMTVEKSTVGFLRSHYILATRIEGVEDRPTIVRKARRAPP